MQPPAVPSLDQIGSSPSDIGAKTDIKNIIHVDLYEVMSYASYLVAGSLINDTPIVRHVKNFYGGFFKIYHLTKLYVDKELRHDINQWLKNMSGNMNNQVLAMDGVKLYIKYFDHISEKGIVTMFSGSIQPDFSLQMPLTKEEVEVARKHPEILDEDTIAFLNALENIMPNETDPPQTQQNEDHADQ